MTSGTIAPVRKSVTVARTPTDAFRIFTEQLADWWPLETHSLDPEHVTGARITPEVGGAIVELRDDGSAVSWGTVRVWEPPRRFVMSWTVTEVETEVEITFTPDGEDTLVEVVHRGWEAYGERVEERRHNYDSGWPGVLARYVAVT